MPLGINLLKNDGNSLNTKIIIHAFFNIAMYVPILQWLM